jgi:hypothetical protein
LLALNDLPIRCTLPDPKFNAIIGLRQKFEFVTIATNPFFAKCVRVVS